ncbi:hypothetical protein ACNKHW_09270 [Shigella flexneri]
MRLNNYGRHPHGDWPVIDNGFYYDVDLEHVDPGRLEKARTADDGTCRKAMTCGESVTWSEARETFASRGEDYKV